MWTIIAIAGLIFLAYAIYTFYAHTEPTQTVPGRLWGSVVAAAGAIGAYVYAWLHQGGVPS